MMNAPNLPYPTSPVAPTGPLPCLPAFRLDLPAPAPPANNTIIPPRSFNSLTFTDSTVTKTSVSSAIRGELHFYLNIPRALSHLFPTLVHHVASPISFTIRRVHGLTLSTLLTSSQLRPFHLEALLLNLHALHSYAAHPPSQLFYANHAAKVRSRFVKHADAIYADLALTSSSHFPALLRRLDAYESAGRARPSAIIHGDPVLTNVLYEPVSNSLKFIDMRGAQASVLTIAGDAIYDLAKLLQSLLCYDFILSDVPISDLVVPQLSAHLDHYWRLVRKLYPDVNPLDILTVTCGLYTSLIPLHDNLSHQRQFALVARVLLDEIETHAPDVPRSSTLVRRIADALKDHISS